MSPEQPLEAPEPSVPQARIERQWTHVRDRLEGRGANRPSWALAIAGAVLVTVLGVGLWPFVRPDAGATTLAEGSAVETRREPMRVALEEGTTIDLGAESRVAIEETQGEDVAVRIERGEARFDVAHRSSGAFRVRTETARGEPIEVVVVGTAFTVSHDDAEVTVRVERGIVEVHAEGRVVRLTRGDTWRSTDPRAAAVDVEPARGSPSASEGSVEVSEGSVEVSEGSVEVSQGSVEVSEGLPGRRVVRPRETLDARALFEQAREARQAGSVAEAARLYGEIVAHHDDDPRADVAAFELARLRMDHLGDPRGALRAIDRALAGGGGAFREDAMARRAVLLDRLGREGECRSAREAYLAAFGAGVHRAEVGGLCP